MTPLLRRVLTALLLLAVFVPAMIWAPGWLWGLLIAAVVGLGAYEWARLGHFPPLFARSYAILFALAAVLLPYAVDARWPAFQNGLVVAAVAFWVIVAPLWLAGHWRGEHRLVRAATGVVVLLPTWAALLYLHARGPGVLLGVLAVVWLADTAAYFAGRRFGRRKLAPVISPGKTWEGVAGAFAVLALYALGLSAATTLPLLPLVVAMAALLYVSVLGDLFESWIKRVAGMKDSGTILPGHGGVLDRIDALTSALPVATAILVWLEHSV